MRRISFGVYLLVIVFVLALVSPVTADFGPLAPSVAPQSHVMDHFPINGQMWNLSCEYAATSAATAYFDKRIGQDAFVQMIPFDANPNKGFRGNLSGPWGGTWDYGIYPEPILAVLLDNGFPHSYIFKADPAILRDAISHDRPVVVWINGTWGWAPQYQEESDGEQYILVPYEHAVTVYGYDESSVYIMDPAYPAYYTVSWGSFMGTWSQLDGMALAVSV